MLNLSNYIKLKKMCVSFDLAYAKMNANTENQPDAWTV